MHVSVKREHGHVEPISLRGELEQRMDLDGPNAERVSWKGFSSWVDNVVSQRDADVTRLGACHAVSRCDDVTAGYERAAASEMKKF